MAGDAVLVEKRSFLNVPGLTVSGCGSGCRHGLLPREKGNSDNQQATEQTNNLHRPLPGARKSLRTLPFRATPAPIHYDPGSNPFQGGPSISLQSAGAGACV